MHLKLRNTQIIGVISLLLYLFHSGGAAFADSDQTSLTEVTDLAADAVTARNERKIILLLISQHDCPYCSVIKKQVLLPMNRSKEYGDKLIIRELFIDFGSSVRSFQGELQTSRDLAYGYGVDLTPTVLFLGPDGEELANRRIGVGNMEYYHYLLDRDIDEALKNLHQQL
jgi:thioredoxin-related protein